MELNECEAAADPLYSLHEEEDEEDEREWCCTVDCIDSSPPTPAAAAAGGELAGDSYKYAIRDIDVPGYKVIVHIDLDCFYAQVEMIRNPEFKGMPLAVHQKHLVVTCNYEARKYGVSKIMSVSEAIDKCPQVIFISGEDLTPYREISYKITELLEEFSPLVQRLGLDENFVDVTKLVEKRLQQIGSVGVPANLFVSGHVYGNQALNISDAKHVWLALGSQFAAEMRTAIYNKVGLTGSAGIATNKLLAKLVSGTFKPNQQTTLLPESIQDCMGSLVHPVQVPGIGPKTARRLEFLGISTIHGLQTFPLDLLEKDLGVCIAQRIHRLSFGEDDSPVIPRGPPQSLSDEDSFRRCSSLAEIRMKIEDLLISLLIRCCCRLQKDGRVPRTIRLTVRRSSASNKWFNRESRQCPVPNQLMQKLNTGPRDAVTPLVDILMKLFQKMVDTRFQFYVSLLNVCFANLIQPTLSSPIRGSIGFYLTQKSPGKLDMSPNGKVRRQLLRERRGSDDADLEGDTADPSRGKGNGGASVSGMSDQVARVKPSLSFPNSHLPPGIDLDVFKELPANIQKEIIAGVNPSLDQLKCNISQARSVEKTPCKGTFMFRSLTEDQRKHLLPLDTDCDPPISSSDTRHVYFHSSTPDSPEAQPQQRAFNDKAASLQEHQPVCETSQSGSMDVERPIVQSSVAIPSGTDPERSTAQSSAPIPSNVDPKVFSELPAELQNELLTDWKQQRARPKIKVAKQTSKVRSNTGARHPKKATKSNSILKYFNKS
ncbi:DNA polymerase iota isoform X1 [Scyliorhinus torazame]|uniref:DNA polymerase iota isoform X1 n=1 Tax=Scyliorhinus torazame TaxID=75743 RepID=UPI003B5C95C3